MKIRKEIFNRILLGILVSILMIYITFNITFFCILNISSKYINEEKIYNIIENVDIVSLLQKEVGEEFEQIDKIKYELLDAGISHESINKFFESSQFKEFCAQIITNVINDILIKENIEYRINEEQLDELLKENIDELNVDSFIEDSKQQIISKVENKLPKLVDKTNKLIEKLGEKLQNSESFIKYKNYFYKSLSILNFIYSDIVNFILIGIIISFIVLLMYITKSIYKSLKWIGMSFIMSSIILYLINLLVIKIIKFNDKFSKLIFNSLSKDLKYICDVCIIIGVVLITSNIVIHIIKKLKSKKIDGVIYEKEEE